MSTNHNHAHQKQGKNLVISIFLNILITVAQVIGGILSGSLALLSDALHNFSDVLALTFSWYANKLSKKQASLNQTFGYKRAELIAAFVNAITLIVVAVFLIYEASIRFFNPEPIQSSLVIWLAFVAIVANGCSVLLLQKDAHHNLNLKSAYLHLFTDMMASVAVLLGGIIMKYLGWFWVDSVLTLLIGLYLIYVSYDLIKTATKMLMLFTPDHIDVEKIILEVHKINTVAKLHHIHVWQLNDDELHLEAHLDCSEDIKLSDFNILIHQIEIVLLDQFGINHVNIQPEFKRNEDSKDFIVQD